MSDPDLPPGLKYGMYAVAAGCAGVAAISLLPVLTQFLSGLVILGLYGVAAVVLFALLTSKEFHRALEVWADQSGAWLRRQGILVNPIETMKSQLARVQARIAEIDEMISAVRGARGSLVKLADEARGEVEQLMAQAQQARKKGDERYAGTRAAMARSSQTRHARYAEKADRLGSYVEALMARRNEAQAVVDLRRHEIRGIEQEYAAMQNASKAARGAEELLGGSGYAVFDEALQITTEQLALMEGQLAHFLDTSASIVEDVEYRQAADAEVGLAALDRWEKTGDLSFDALTFEEIKDEARAKSPRAQGRIAIPDEPAASGAGGPGRRRTRA